MSKHDINNGKTLHLDGNKFLVKLILKQQQNKYSIMLDIYCKHVNAVKSGQYCIFKLHFGELNGHCNMHEFF